MADAVAAAPEPEFFKRYLATAATWMQVASVKHRSAAIQLSKHPLQELDGAAMLEALRGALDGPWWRKTAADRGSNWVWRDSVPSHQTQSEEVVLERTLAALSPDRWTCQMSTCSGLRPGRTDARRAIDLVQRVGQGHYRFIELKVGSDHPLYAAFEVFAYGLLYLLARQHKRRGSGRYDVMTARRVELVVLGPATWYDYKLSRGAAVSRFDLNWLVSAINLGLASEIGVALGDGALEMKTAFRTYEEQGSVAADCAAIDEGLP